METRFVAPRHAAPHRTAFSSFSVPRTTTSGVGEAAGAHSTVSRQSVLGSAFSALASQFSQSVGLGLGARYSSIRSYRRRRPALRSYASFRFVVLVAVRYAASRSIALNFGDY